MVKYGVILMKCSSSDLFRWNWSDIAWNHDWSSFPSFLETPHFQVRLDVQTWDGFLLMWRDQIRFRVTVTCRHCCHLSSSEVNQQQEEAVANFERDEMEAHQKYQPKIWEYGCYGFQTDSSKTTLKCDQEHCENSSTLQIACVFCSSSEIGIDGICCFDHIVGYRTSLLQQLDDQIKDSKDGKPDVISEDEVEVMQHRQRLPKRLREQDIKIWKRGPLTREKVNSFLSGKINLL